jgi:site-specific DNA-methyltransferase (adenine-specific)
VAWSPERAAAYVREAWQHAVESIVETGRRLLEERERTPHGRWDDVVALLPFGARTAQQLMAIARHPLLANARHASHLPPAWDTLYRLSRLDDLDERIAGGDVTPELERSTVDGWLRDKARDRYALSIAEYARGANRAGDRWEVREGAFQQALADLPFASVDAIVTDPPYSDDDLWLWSELAVFASRVLRRGAPLIAWSGQYRLAAVLDALGEHLRYGWTICLDLPGTNGRFRGPNVLQTWKPILVFTAERWAPHNWHRDRVVSPARDQELFEWQQHPEPAAELIERYVPAGGLVVDPFCGVGSFGVAALTTGRRFLAAELDPGRADTASARLAEAAAT